MPNRKFVIDTSLFVNPASRKKFGKTPKSAVKGFIKKIKGVDAEFYIPPLVFKELLNFIDEKTAHGLEVHIKKRAPNMHAIYLPAAVFDDFVEDVRARMGKGLRLAEEFARDNRPDNELKLRKLREKYRSALRAGILDSREDFELLLLAKELEATVVTSDEGVIKFADSIGCERLNAGRFYDLLTRLKKRK
jgi:RNA ligase partner protein